MSDDQTARLGLPYLAAGQMQKHVTLNEALTRLDALVQMRVISRSTADQPPTPADGDLYILPDDRTGADWSRYPAGSLVRSERGGWIPVEVPEGSLAVVSDVGECLLRKAGTWAGLGCALRDVGPVRQFAVGADPDDGNPFTARLNSALWTALDFASGGSGDLRMVLNKEAPSDVLSLLFQSGYAGRAELGLVGDDDLVLKVSADDGTWRTALTVDRASGRVIFDLGAGRRETSILTENGDWVAPAWARTIEAVVVGGGGAGGGGAFGASGDRYGGGGGGAGGVSAAIWSADRLHGPLSVIVGVGGSGGSIANGEGGGNSSLSLGGVIILSAAGGGGGARGDASSGAGGAGGSGAPRSNRGGDSRLGAAGEVGESDNRTDAPGGGGAGGALPSSGAARAGGSGGDGGVQAVRASGGVGGSGGGGWGGWSAPLPGLHWSGGGGGGGGAATSGSGHAGGAAGAVGGGGGGGGGAGVTAGGTGGAGAGGVIWLTAVG